MSMARGFSSFYSVGNDGNGISKEYIPYFGDLTFYNFDVVNDSLKNAFSVAIELNFHPLENYFETVYGHRREFVYVKDYMSIVQFAYFMPFRCSCWHTNLFCATLNRPKSICPNVPNSS